MSTRHGREPQGLRPALLRLQGVYNPNSLLRESVAGGDSSQAPDLLHRLWAFLLRLWALLLRLWALLLRLWALLHRLWALLHRIWPLLHRLWALLYG